ncbi:polysaccharide biosynthesis tyrosine autokinase [Pelagicoccus sp. SDUM812003]|uniref:GumC family protein n=1 Tax=Pelagicoccus sp. SDUM812003 TaxID=3041267 RepID=UPI00280D1DBE|nr:polysaccharide biosynthesis tyrosine autokinase [Pelagicoccus sp. SDUM812003]MDQ8203594.1 polysaccharide biosynthesis tyrosine autokinase [Pelagicoccus sp. SDUM812003]
MSNFEQRDRFDSSDRNPAGANGNGSYPYGASRSAGQPSYSSSSRKGTSKDLTMVDLINQIRNMFAILRRRFFAGLFVAAIVAVGLGSFLLREPPEQTAMTTILAQSTFDEVLNRANVATGGKDDDQEMFLINQLSFLKSRRFADMAANEFTEEEKKQLLTPYLEQGETFTETGFRNLVGSKMGADRERDRELFIISFRHRDPELAKLATDRIASKFVSFLQNETKNANREAAQSLTRQAETLEEEISSINEKIRAYKLEKKITSIEDTTELLQERLAYIEKSQTQASIERATIETQLAGAKVAMENSQTPFANPTLASYGNNEELRKKRVDLMVEKKALSSRYGPKHPAMIELTNEIEGLSEAIQENFALAYEELESQYDMALKQEAKLRKELDRSFSESQEIDALADRIRRLEEEARAKALALAEVSQRASMADVNSSLPADVMRVIDSAYIDSPFLSEYKLNIIFVSGCSLLALFAVPLTLHCFDDKLKSATDVEVELDQDLIGGVPKLSRTRKKDRPHVVRDRVDPSKVEPFMSTIVQMELLSSQESSSRTFVVTSTIPGEGKSTIASNIASGFTQLGRKTLLIDCDLRRPSQHLMNGIDSKRGLVYWSNAGYSLEQDLFSVDSPLGIHALDDGTHLLPSGGSCVHPTKILVSAHFGRLFDALREHYDVIIVDTPPAGLFPDSLIVSQQPGETLLVAREEKAKLPKIRRVITDINKTNAPLLGMVLNAFSASSLNARVADKYTYRDYGYKMKKGKRPKTKGRRVPVA